MSDIEVTTSYTLGRTISDTVTIDITEQIHEAVVDGVINCGGYDVEIVGGDMEYVDVNASGTVGVSIDGQSAVEEHVESEYDLDPYDYRISDVVAEQAWRDSTGLDLAYEIEVEQDIEHEASLTMSDIAIDMRRILQGIGADGATTTLHEEARKSLYDLIRAFLGQQFLDAYEDGEI